MKQCHHYNEGQAYESTGRHGARPELAGKVHTHWKREATVMSTPCVLPGIPLLCTDVSASLPSTRGPLVQSLRKSVGLSSAATVRLQVSNCNRSRLCTCVLWRPGQIASIAWRHGCRTGGGRQGCSQRRGDDLGRRSGSAPTCKPGALFKGCASERRPISAAKHRTDVLAMCNAGSPVPKRRYPRRVLDNTRT